MIEKYALYRSGENGAFSIPLFSKADSYFEKVAEPQLVTPVIRYIEKLRPRDDSQYVLTNAMGASEYFSSNINGDAFYEPSLLHVPDGWTGNPIVDKIKAKDWPYGYPTFYFAYPYAHHKNKDPSKAYGEVELTVWNDRMKRVELIIRLDKDKCEKFGGMPVWDRLKAGQFPDVSMGCFTAGNLVTMADGTRKPIEDVQVGDLVLTHLGNSKKVTEVHKRKYSDALYKIRAKAHETVIATRQHPFLAVPDAQVKGQDSYRQWVGTSSMSPSWVNAEDLGSHCLLEPTGEELGTPNRVLAGYLVSPIQSIEANDAEVDVYNLEVEDDHSYLVAGLAVHNCRVPFDRCSICSDRALYEKVLQTFNPKRHKHPGMAVLEFHKKLKASNGKGIRGLAVTRADYCVHAAKQMNRILDDGRKVCVYNDFPRFFDISFVFIGADKTAKVMLKLASASQQIENSFDPISEMFFKGASIGFRKKAYTKKKAEIEKSVVSQLSESAIPVVTRKEPSLPKEILNELSKHPLASTLSTASRMGIILKPKEFQRIILVRMGKPEMADQLDLRNQVFPRVQESSSFPISLSMVSDIIQKILQPFMAERSFLSPAFSIRITKTVATPMQEDFPCPCQASGLICKISSAYNGYRNQVMQLLPENFNLAASHSNPLVKEAHSIQGETDLAMAKAYVQKAYWDEVVSF